MNNKKPLWPLLVFGAIAIAIVFLLTGCADANPHKGSRDSSGDVAGFWFGMWNGLTCPISLVGSLLSDSITVYEVHNVGFRYNIGFLLGVFFLCGFIFKSSKHQRATIHTSETITLHSPSNVNISIKKTYSSSNHTPRKSKSPATEEPFIDV